MLTRRGERSNNGHVDMESNETSSVEHDLAVLAREREALSVRHRELSSEYGALKARIHRLSLQSSIGRPGAAAEVRRLERYVGGLRDGLDQVARERRKLDEREDHLRAALPWETLSERL